MCPVPFSMPRATFGSLFARDPLGRRAGLGSTREVPCPLHLSARNARAWRVGRSCRPHLCPSSWRGGDSQDASAGGRAGWLLWASETTHAS